MGRHMASRVLPAGLLLATLVADAQGLHDAGFYVLVAAVPAAAVAALSAFGDVVERGDVSARLEVILGGLGLVLVLVAAATRGQGADSSAVTVAALVVLAPTLLVRTGAPWLRRAPAR